MWRNIFLDKTENALEVKLQMTDQEKDMERGALLDLQMKLADILKSKEEIEMMN